MKPHSRIGRHDHREGPAPASNRNESVSDWSTPPPRNATAGKEYDAVKTLQRLKYLETILNAPNISFESIRDAQREKATIFAHVAD